MKKSRFSEEQITYALRQADSGTPVADICRQLSVSEASFYHWRKKYGRSASSYLSLHFMQRSAFSPREQRPERPSRVRGSA